MVNVFVLIYQNIYEKKKPWMLWEYNFDIYRTNETLILLETSKRSQTSCSSPIVGHLYILWYRTTLAMRQSWHPACLLCVCVCMCSSLLWCPRCRCRRHQNLSSISPYYCCVHVLLVFVLWLVTLLFRSLISILIM